MGTIHLLPQPVARDLLAGLSTCPLCQQPPFRYKNTLLGAVAQQANTYSEIR